MDPSLLSVALRMSSFGAGSDASTAATTIQTPSEGEASSEGLSPAVELVFSQQSQPDDPTPLRRTNTAPAKVRPGPQPGQHIIEGFPRPARAATFPEARVTCRECGQTFSQRPNFWRHKTTKHNQVSQLYCPICDKCFTRRDNLKTHMSEQHQRVLRPKDVAPKRLLSPKRD